MEDLFINLLKTGVHNLLVNADSHFILFLEKYVQNYVFIANVPHCYLSDKHVASGTC